MKTVYNNKDFDFTKEYMFFGEQLNAQRYDKQKYPKFEAMNRRMIALYWVPEEIDMSKDKTDFKSLSEAEQHIYISNLQYQIVMDSVQGRCPAQIMAQMVSLPELEGCFLTQSFYEVIHSRSYSHMVRNIFSDPSVVFDQMTKVNEVLGRATAVTSTYDRLYNAYIKKMAGDESITEYHLKELMHDAMVSMNILESIRFYVSFACNLNLDKQGFMKGSGNIITLIARDEAEHKNFTRYILNLWRNGSDDPDMTKIWNERKDIRLKLFEDAVREEIEWTDYLFKFGSMRGFNKKIAITYLYHVTNQALKGIGEEPMFAEIKENPIEWINHYFSSKGRQNAPQETENVAYLTGAISTTEDDFKGLTL